LDLKPKATKTKKSQLALHQTKKLLHSKKKKKDEKSTNKMGENICKTHIQ